MSLTKLEITVDRRRVDRDFTDLRVWFRATVRPETAAQCLRCGAPRDESHTAFCYGPDPSGLGHVSFLFLAEEWRAACEDGGDFSDVAHRLRAWGEDWVFFDLPDFRGAGGVAACRWARVKLPRDVRARLVADVAAAVERYDAQPVGEYGDKPEIRLDYTADLESWESEFGQGTGRVELHPNTNAATRDMIGALCTEASESWVRSWDTIQRLARNTTHRRADVGIVAIYRESDRALMWTAGGMHGGIINHGADAPDWSVHT